MSKLTRRQCNNIIKIRTKMLPVKANHASSYSNKACGICKGTDETQKHILTECPGTLNKIAYDANFTKTERLQMVKLTENVTKALEILDSNQENT